MTGNRWSSYWAMQETPRHVLDDESFYQDLAREILFHTGLLKGKTVLEIGCGNGAIFTHLDIDPKKYTGVDFSDSLLEQFSRRGENLKLVKQDALGFLRSATDKYDVILSFGVLQYLSGKELDELFRLQAKALKQDGLCAHFGLPVTDLDAPFYKGLGSSHALSRTRPRGLLKQAVSRFRNRIGHWHSISDLYRQSRAAGYSTRIVSNIYYFYRVNLLQSLESVGADRE